MCCIVPRDTTKFFSTFVNALMFCLCACISANRRPWSVPDAGTVSAQLLDRKAHESVSVFPSTGGGRRWAEGKEGGVEYQQKTTQLFVTVKEPAPLTLSPKRKSLYMMMCLNFHTVVLLWPASETSLDRFEYLWQLRIMTSWAEFMRQNGTD